MLTENSGCVTWLEGDRYRIVFSMGRKPNGKRNCVYRRGRGTPEDAENHRRREAKKLVRGRTAPKRMRVEELLKRYEDDRRADWRRKTQMDHAWIRRRLTARMGKLLVVDLTPQVGTDFKVWALKSGAEKGGPLSPKSVREHLSFFLSALDFAVDQRWIDSNPVRRKRLLPRAEEPPVTWLELDEIRPLLDRLNDDPQLRDAVSILLDTGLRIGELLGLRWRDIDPERRILNVTLQLQRAKRTNTWLPIKTAAGVRQVPYGKRTQRRLETLANEVAANGLPSDGQPLSARSILVDALGRPMTYKALAPKLSRVMTKLGYHGLFHTLRHTWVTHMLRAGVDPKTLTVWAGHADPGYLLRRYAHALRTPGDAPSYFDQLEARGSDPRSGWPML